MRGGAARCRVTGARLVAEPAGQPGPVQGNLGALAGVVGDALDDGTAVPGADTGEVGVAEAGLACGAGGGGPGALFGRPFYRNIVPQFTANEKPLAEGRRAF